jgi:DNA (cytosine-5)-methyltransferase 1
MMNLSHLDLCSGIGGFHLAAEWTGFQTIGFSEIEPYCGQLLVEKWPLIKNYGDLRTADFSELRGRITILSAGVPCQPASLAGKRKGNKDDRWLWDAVLDVVESVEPVWCIFENPSGILSLDEFGGVLLRLAAIGYEVRAFSVPANAVGAKHRRQRVFIVAYAERERRDWRPDGWGAAQSGPCSEIERPSQDTETLADTERARRCESRSIGSQTTVRRQPADQGCATLADADAAGLEELQPWDAGQCATALRNGGADGFRLTQSPLCRRADGISHRSHRLKALGNAVVPQQAYPFFEAIAQTEWGRGA